MARLIRETPLPVPMVPPRARPITPRNLAGLARYLGFRLRYPGQRVGLFYLDRGADLHIGPKAQLHLGHGIRIMRDFSAHLYGEVYIGNGVFFNRGCHLIAQEAVTIGDHCLFGEMVSIHDDNHVYGRGSRPLAERGLRTAPVVIGNNVWVGAKATILPGVTIGDNAVVGANAVVSKDVPAHCVVGGVPARVIREF